MLMAGCAAPHLGPILLLVRKPLQVIGKLPYPWYLWHWPVLILAPTIVRHSLALWENLALAALSLALAVATPVVGGTPYSVLTLDGGARPPEPDDWCGRQWDGRGRLLRSEEPRW